MTMVTVCAVLLVAGLLVWIGRQSKATTVRVVHHATVQVSVRTEGAATQTDDEVSVDLSELTIEAIRARLRAEGLPGTGTKSELTVQLTQLYRRHGKRAVIKL